MENSNGIKFKTCLDTGDKIFEIGDLVYVKYKTDSEECSDFGRITSIALRKKYKHNVERKVILNDRLEVNINNIIEISHIDDIVKELSLSDDMKWYVECELQRDDEIVKVKDLLKRLIEIESMEEYKGKTWTFNQIITNISMTPSSYY